LGHRSSGEAGIGCAAVLSGLQFEGTEVLVRIEIHMPGYFLLGVCAALVVVLPAASQTAEEAPASGTNKAKVIKSTAEFRKLVPLGISTNQLVGLLGKPEWVDEVSDRTMWTYFLPEFPADDDMRGTYVCGVTAYITNAHVAILAFMYRGGPTKTVRREEIVGSGESKPPAMRLLIVNTNASEGAQFIDTPQLPKVGYVAAIPNLIVTNLDELTLEEQHHTDSEGKTRTNWAFAVALSREDGKRLATLTSTNINKRLLVSVGDKPIVAPMIMETLETGRFQISCNETMRDYVKSNLAKLKR